MREEFIHSQLSTIMLSYLATESSRLRDEDVYFSADRLHPSRYCSVRSRVLNGRCAVSTTVQRILLYTAQILFNGYYSVLTRDYSMDIAQYSTENSLDIAILTTQWKLHNSPEFKEYC
jgi:hypothetical protein